MKKQNKLPLLYFIKKTSDGPGIEEQDPEVCAITKLTWSEQDNLLGVTIIVVHYLCLVPEKRFSFCNNSASIKLRTWGRLQIPLKGPSLKKFIGSAARGTYGCFLNRYGQIYHKFLWSLGRFIYLSFEILTEGFKQNKALKLIKSSIERRITEWLQNISPKQEGLGIKTDTEDCIFLIVSQANYALLKSFVYQRGKKRQLRALSSNSLMLGNIAQFIHSRRLP